jgi:hypothetical protein
MKKFPGIYETDYGNVAFVNADDVKQAWDIDAAEWIPIELVDLNRFIREATEEDTPLEDMFEDILEDLDDLDKE